MDKSANTVENRPADSAAKGGELKTDWQPIATAPLKRVLVRFPEFPMGDLAPLPPSVAIRHMGDIENNAREIRQPSHWMHLPSATLEGAAS